jgi:hypothetical protein
MTIHFKLNRRKKSKEKSNFLKKYFARNWARSPNEIEKPLIRKSREYPAMGGVPSPRKRDDYLNDLRQTWYNILI